jgi:hypothetical protein
MNYQTITALALQFQDGLENPSGLQEQGWLIPISAIKTEGIPVPAATAGSFATIGTSHILNTGKSPIPVSMLYAKSGVQFKLGGEELSKMFESDVELFIPQISANVLGSAAAIKNTRYILLLRRPGQLTGFWQIGTVGMSAKVQDIAGGFGTGPTGEVGIKVSLKSFDVIPMYEYTGDLPVLGV